MSRRTVGWGVAVGSLLLLAWCGSGGTAPTTTVTVTVPAAQADSPSSASAPAPAEVGQTVRNLGATIEVESVKEATKIELNESSYRPGSGYESYTSTPAGPNAKFVIVTTHVTNDSSTSFDLTCSLPISTKLVDAQNRQFDSIDDLYKIKNNPECNKSLQPGFDDDMTWIYRVPASAQITTWEFEDASDMSTIGSNEPTAVAVRLAG